MTWNAERLKALRKTYGETQPQFAARMGVSAATITYWETGKKQSRIPPMACKLLDRLELEAPKQLQSA